MPQTTERHDFINLDVYGAKDTHPSAPTPLWEARSIESSRVEHDFPVVAMGCRTVPEIERIELEVLSYPLIEHKEREFSIIRERKQTRMELKQLRKSRKRSSFVENPASSIPLKDMVKVDPKRRYLRPAQQKNQIASVTKTHHHRRASNDSQRSGDDTTASPIHAAEGQGREGRESALQGSPSPAARKSRVSGASIPELDLGSGSMTERAKRITISDITPGEVPATARPTRGSQVGFHNMFYGGAHGLVDDDSNGQQPSQREQCRPITGNPFDCDQDILRKGMEMIGISRPDSQADTATNRGFSQGASRAQSRRSSRASLKTPAVRVNPAHVTLTREEKKIWEKEHRAPTRMLYSRRSTDLPFIENTRPKTVFYSEFEKKMRDEQAAAGFKEEQPKIAPGSEAYGQETDRQFMKKFNQAVKAGRRKRPHWPSQMLETTYAGVRAYFNKDFDQAENSILKSAISAQVLDISKTSLDTLIKSAAHDIQVGTHRNRSPRLYFATPVPPVDEIGNCLPPQ